MSAKDPSIFIEHIIEFIENIRLFTKDVSKKQFVNNKEKVNAVVRCLEIIGEAANNLPRTFMKEHPNIDWKGIIGTRNVVIHKYFEIKFDTIWEIINIDLPVLEKQMRQLKFTLQKKE